MPALQTSHTRLRSRTDSPGMQAVGPAHAHKHQAAFEPGESPDDEESVHRQQHRLDLVGPQLESVSSSGFAVVDARAAWLQGSNQGAVALHETVLAAAAQHQLTVERRAGLQFGNQFRRIPAAERIAKSILIAIASGERDGAVAAQRHAGQRTLRAPGSQAVLLRQPGSQEARLTRRDLPWLAGVAFFGALVGPVALAWGLQRASGAGASLMLTMEALFTAGLARILYGETMDRRVWLAMLTLLAGGVLLVVDQARSGQDAGVLGLVAVLVATAAWGTDNALSRALADRDPGQVVLAKSSLGASCALALAMVFGEAAPTIVAAAALLAIGACGYGLSLRFYLLAQRRFGAARTGSVFACAPFLGALGALVLGDRSGSWLMAGAGGLMALGVWTHLAERHEHEHQHEALEHEHAHSHDDGHHDHPHNPMPHGSHSHPHVHVPVRHAHPHAPDLHHQHRH